MIRFSVDPPIEDHVSGGHDLVEEVEIPNVPGQHRIAPFQRMQVYRPIIECGELQTRLQGRQPEQEAGEDARLDHGSGCRRIDPVLRDVGDQFPELAYSRSGGRMCQVEPPKIMRELAERHAEVIYVPVFQQRSNFRGPDALQHIDLNNRIEQQGGNRRAARPSRRRDRRRPVGPMGRANG
jgi:hypothetical protein